MPTFSSLKPLRFMRLLVERQAIFKNEKGVMEDRYFDNGLRREKT
jgi:hypothetical protein